MPVLKVHPLFVAQRRHWLVLRHSSSTDPREIPTSPFLVLPMHLRRITKFLLYFTRAQMQGRGGFFNQAYALLPALTDQVPTFGGLSRRLSCATSVERQHLPASRMFSAEV